MGNRGGSGKRRIKKNGDKKGGGIMIKDGTTRPFKFAELSKQADATAHSIDPRSK